ncbi:unnamed protein product [Agarophyton chilense]
MDISVTPSLVQSDISAVAKHNHSIVLSCFASHTHTSSSLLLATRNQQQWKTSPISHALPNVSHFKHAHMSFGTQLAHIYVSLPDVSNHIFVLSRGNASTEYHLHNTLQTSFESPVLAMCNVCQPASTPDQPRLFTVLVSERGQVAVVHDSTGEPLLCDKSGFNLSLEHVLNVSSTGNNLVSVIGRTKGCLHLYILRLRHLQTSDSIELSCSAPVLISEPSEHPSNLPGTRQTRIIDIALKSRSLCVLYEGGHLCFFELRPSAASVSPAANGLDFFSAPFQATPKSPQLAAVMYHALVLRASQSPQASPRAGDGGAPGGFVESVWRDFFVVGYGRFISVWDQQYVCGHGFALVDHDIRRICATPTDAGEATFVSDRGLHELSISNRTASGAVSLAMVLKRKALCDEVVERVTLGMMKAPLQSHPLSIAPIKAAADADSDSTKRFQEYVSGEDDREDSIIRELLTKSKTPTAESVLSLISDCTNRDRGVRHDSYNMGLKKLPSERLAAVSTARCLYELHCGQVKFLVPLVDMLGTGVVSSEAVLAVADVSDSWDMGIDRESFRMNSIIDPLMSPLHYSYALEAVVRAVADLPEQDIVRVMRHAIHLADAAKIEEGNGDMLSTKRSHKQTAHVRLERARRLFEVCLECCTDTDQMIRAVRRLPFSDIITFLNHFRTYLTSSTAVTAVEESTRTELPKALKALQFGAVEVAFGVDSAVSFRGIRKWVDNERLTKRKRRAFLMKGCISWACCTIDAHLSTLILDESGRKLAEQLLQAVKERRKESQGLKELQGLTGHLVNKKGVPSGPDALYNTRVVLVPRDAALL